MCCVREAMKGFEAQVRHGSMYLFVRSLSYEENELEE